jgi:acyl carrier protein
MNIKLELQEIFRELFDDDEIELFDEMTADDIEDWDSLSHISLIKDIESRFNIEFTTEELVSAKNVGEFIALINSKLQ